MGSVSNILTMNTALPCLLSVGLALVTSSLLPVNLTLAAYGAAIVLGGSILGLVLYFLATQTRTRYNGGYYNNYYNHHGHGHSQYLVDRMDQARGFDILGLIGNALNM